MATKKTEQDYQALSLELDTVLARLQASDIQVDEAVRLYEQGLKLIEQLEQRLTVAENRIEQLKLAATREG